MTRRATSTGLLTLLATLLGSLPLQAQVDPRYVALVERYARGDYEGAVYDVDGWTYDQASRFAQELQSMSSRGWPPGWLPESRFLRAAAMLHLDSDEAHRPRTEDREHARPCTGPQATVAARYATILAQDPEEKAFAKRFFLALARVSQWDACLTAAEKWARDGLKLFPTDPELHVAAGSASEENATVGWDESIPNPSPAPRYRSGARLDTANRRFLLEEARRHYDLALAADDGLHAARLRMGRILWRLGRSDAARAALERVVGEAPEVSLRFLGHLFLGRVHEDAERLDEAAIQYRQALELDPHSQSAGLALANVLRLGGDEKAARAAAENAVSFAGQRGGRDWFWTYLTEPVSPDDLLNDLRRQVSR